MLPQITLHTKHLVAYRAFIVQVRVNIQGVFRQAFPVTKDFTGKEPSKEQGALPVLLGQSNSSRA